GADNPIPVVGVPLGACPIKPELDQGSVVGAKLLELPGVKLAVRFGIAVTRGVAVPRRAVKPGQDPFLPAGVDKLADHIAFPVPPRRALDGVGRRLGGPEAKAVVVLGGEDGIPHARLFSNPRPLTAIESRGVKQCGIFGPVTPLPAGKRNDAKMDKEAKLEVLPAELLRRRQV